MSNDGGSKQDGHQHEAQTGDSESGAGQHDVQTASRAVRAGLHRLSRYSRVTVILRPPSQSWGADDVCHPVTMRPAVTRLSGKGGNDTVGRSMVSKRRTIEVVVVVVGLVFLFGFLAVVILSLFFGIG